MKKLLSVILAVVITLTKTSNHLLSVLSASVEVVL